MMNLIIVHIIKRLSPLMALKLTKFYDISSDSNFQLEQSKITILIIQKLVPLLIIRHYTVDIIKDSLTHHIIILLISVG